MVLAKLKKLMAVTLASSMVVTGVPVSESSTISASAKTTTDSESEDVVALADDTDLSEDDEGVYKVTMDESGYITADGSSKYDPDGEYARDVNTPFSWDNVNTYFVITDRFYNGDKSNDHSYGRSGNSSNVPSSYKSTFEEVAGSYASAGEKEAASYESRVGTFHGGDLKGLTEYIDNGYFDALGTNAIWITAPYEQVHGAVFGGGFKHYAYHGYYTLDYTEVDANMGTAEDLENFIDTAHKHGIRVIFDVVMNHSGYPDAYTIAEYYGANSELLTSKWQKSYFGESESSYKWEWDYTTKDSEHGALNYTSKWDTSWFTTSWQRMMAGRYSDGYNNTENDPELTGCSAGLPDFMTEDSKGKPLPDILSKKWSKEGQLTEKTAETNAMLKACGYGSIGSASVKQYLVAWLSNWVREYGVDGFRCDTAKHVTIDCWKDLNTQCDKALKEWRKNNPNKPGAQWTDDFWMTGEVYDQGLSMNYGGVDYSQAFDSLINFGFQGKAGLKGSALESTYSEYAAYCNSGSGKNALSYVSSHDKGIGARGASVGTALLLCPGGVQTYYGDETSRQAGGGSGDQPSRSQMTWNDKACLANWQKVGRFRRDHIAVGAGQHKKISDSPYTFSRTYTGKATVGSETKTDYEDKVVVSLPGSAGTYEVSVGSVFADGTTLMDSYSGEEYTVSGGKVSVTCDSNGVILLGQPVESTPKAKVSASVTSGKVSNDTYSDDSITVSLTASNLKDAKYTVDGHDETAFTDTATVEIGKATAYDETTTIKVTGTSTIDASEFSKEFKYTRSSEPKIGGIATTGLYVRAKKSDFASAPYIYIYDATHQGENSYTGAWKSSPKMTLDGDYYVYSLEDITTEVMIIIFTENEAWRSTPDMEDPKLVKGSVELQKGANSGTFESFTMENPDAVACKVTINYVDQAGTTVKSIYRVGEEGKDYTAYLVDKLYDKDGKLYTPVEGQKDTTDKFTKEEKTVTFTYAADGVVVTPTPSVEPTVEPSATPSATPEAATPEPTVEPTVEPTATPTATPTVKPTAEVTPTPTVVPTVEPTPEPEQFKASVTTNVKTQVNGYYITIKASATGGSGDYRYRFEMEDSSGRIVKKSNSGQYSTNATYKWKTNCIGEAVIYAYVWDVKQDKVVSAEEIVKVTSPLSMKKYAATRVSKLKYKLGITASGGSKSYKYKYQYTYKGKTKTIKGYSSKKAITVKMKKAGTYKFIFYVKDTKGKVVKKSKVVKVR